MSPDSGLGLTADELAWLEANKDSISYGPNPYWPPGDYMEDGVHKGIVADYIAIFERKLDIKFKRAYYGDWKTFYQALLAGEFDLVGAVQETAERKKSLVFTQPFLKTRLSVLTRSNSPPLTSLDRLNSMKIAGIAGYSSLDYVREHYPGGTIIESEDDLTVLLKLSAGAADAAVVDYMAASYLIQKYGITNLKYAGELDFHWDLRFGINLQKAPLAPILNKVLNSISQGTQESIYNKWVVGIERTPTFLERNLNSIAVGVFVFMALSALVTVVIFNRSLRKQVHARTYDLQSALAFNEALIREAPIGITVCDASGQAIVTNDVMAEMFGSTTQAVLSRNYHDLESWKGTGLYKAALKAADTKEPQHHSFNVMTAAGKNIYVNCDITPIGAGGEQLMFMMRDVTAQKQAELSLLRARDELEEEVRSRTRELEIAKEIAEKANAAKSDFLASMSHDLRTPLNAIMGFTDMIRHKAFGPIGNERYEEYVNDIHASGELLVSLVNDVLDLSKIEAGQYDLNEGTIVIEDLIKACLNQNKIAADDKKLTIHCDVPAKFPSLRGDERTVIQILNNLISNAVKFSHEGKSVWVHAAVTDRNEIKVSVVDEGIGISSADIDDIQKPFTQANAEHARKHEGTGLGLYLVQKLVTLHGGRFQIASKLGQGTTAEVTFPARRTI